MIRGHHIPLAHDAVVLRKILLGETRLVVRVRESLAHELGHPGFGAGVVAAQAGDDEGHVGRGVRWVR